MVSAAQDAPTETPATSSVDVTTLIRTDCADPADPLRIAWTSLALDYQARYGDPLVGRHRMTFLDGERVHKLPRSFDGMIANAREANWKSTEMPIAACSLHVEMPSGINVLRMERVQPCVGQTLPDWTMSIDCQQVGYTADGRLVAYDL